MSQFETTRGRGPRSGRSGFTLIEVLVSITILSIISIVIQRAVTVSANGTVRAERRIAAEMVARTLLTGPLGLGADATKPRSGTMNGFGWTLRFEPVNLPFPDMATDDKPPGWRPVKMLVTVTAQIGQPAAVTVSAVRLVKVASQ